MELQTFGWLLMLLPGLKSMSLVLGNQTKRLHAMLLHAMLGQVSTLSLKYAVVAN